MQVFSRSKNFFTAGILFLLLACNSNSTKEKEADKKQTDTVAPLPPPKVEVSPDVKKCYANDGLKYKTVVTLLFVKKNGEDIVSGNVTSEELGSGKTERGVFEGTINGDKFMIKFVGNPPTTGDASEWTDKPWTLEHLPGKGQWMEKLHIIFNAKNYDTNKWEDTDYQFVMVDCK